MLGLNNFKSNLFQQKLKNEANYQRKRKSLLNLPSKIIEIENIQKEILELKSEYAKCYNQDDFKLLFDSNMIGDLILIENFRIKFSNFIKKFKISVSKKENFLVSNNEEGCFILEFAEIWIIYINLNEKKFSTPQMFKIINHTLTHEINTELMFKFFKYIIKLLNVKKKFYWNISDKNEKYKEFLENYQKFQGELYNSDKIILSISNENIKTNYAKILKDIIEEEELKSECNELFTFIPISSSILETSLEYKYILTPVRISDKNIRSCEKIIKELRKDNNFNRVRIKPNKHLAEVLREMNYKTEVLEDLFKEMVEKDEKKFNFRDLLKIRSVQIRLKMERHINITNFFKINPESDLQNPFFLKISSENKNFSLLDIMNTQQNLLVSKPYKINQYNEEFKKKEANNNLINDSNLKKLFYLSSENMSPKHLN